MLARLPAGLGGVRDPERILLSMEGGMKARAAGHAVLSLIADAALPRPLWPASLPDDVSVVERWRRALGIPPPAVRLRASHWVLTAGR